MELPAFEYDAGALCLDFANTMEWHASPHPKDRLVDYPTLVAWAQAADLLPADQAAHLRALAAQQPDAAAVALAEAIDLRETLYRIFSNLAAQSPADPADLDLLNGALQRALPRLRLLATDEGFQWRWRLEPPAFEQILWPITRSATELLTSDQLDRLRECADDRGCGYLFIDMSRNRSRRWCSMETCGNRAKAKRHYRRLKQ